MNFSNHILLLLLFLGPSYLTGQRLFERPIVIDKSDGLPHDRVEYITKDPLGFMWFSTRDGLCRFDGTTTKVYRPEVNNPHSILHTSVSGVLADTTKIWAIKISLYFKGE